MRHFTSDIAVDEKSPSTGLLSFRRFFSLCTKSGIRHLSSVDGKMQAPSFEPIFVVGLIVCKRQILLVPVVNGGYLHD